MIGFCNCGCGRKTTIAPFSNLKMGYKKGEPRIYISGHNNKKSEEERLRDKKESLRQKGHVEGQLCKCGCGSIVKLGNIYINGHYRKGRKIGPFSDKHKKKLSLSHLGLPSNNKGKKASEETKQKIRLARLNQITPVKDTKIEIKIRTFLEQLNMSYKKHLPIRDIKHFYPCDIYISEYNLIIECDGNYWHKYPDGTEIDYIRTKELQEQGYKVLRLWESDINKMDIKIFIDILKNYGVMI